mmetsp:Transcript_92133/g.260779  ORF Transcript_92133/g.260779 Transcript_92133/m.260779 type:complete len:395 (+) Transcript_92133:51-1235(+)
MEVFDTILADWESCGPDGVVLRADRLSDVIDLVAHRVAGSSACRSSRRYALELLRPSDEEGGLPMLVRHLRVDGGYRVGGAAPVPGIDCTGCAVVHFVCFWKALHEVWRRIGRGGGDAVEEPIAEEAAAFRDALLRGADDGVLTPAGFLAELGAARKMSADPAAWSSLEVVARPELQGAPSGPLRLGAVSELLLPWLRGTADDYLRGDRADKIQAVRDVMASKSQALTVREACVHLGASGWDIELALRSFYVAGPPLAASTARSPGAPWNSQGARLRSSEVQCPICAADFRPGAEPLVTACCFQVICEHCVASLATKADDQLRCPFCRSVSERPGISEKGQGSHGDDLLAEVLRVAGKYAGEATRITRGLVASFQAEEHVPRHDLRYDVIFRTR